MKKILYTIGVLSVILFVSGCEGFLKVEKYGASTKWETEEDVEKAVVALLSNVSNNSEGITGRGIMWFECCSDNVTVGRPQAQAEQIRNFLMSADNGRDAKNNWPVMYEINAKANNLIRVVPGLGLNKAFSDKAIATALKLAPDNSETLYYHGKILKSKKNYAQALSALEKAARKQEIRSKCFFERGCCYLETNSLEKAEFEFTRAIKSSKQLSAPEVLYSRYLLADCYERQRNIDQAIEQWEAISAVNPKFRNTAQKLAEYSDLRTNDHMKEYLTLIKEEFFKMCRDITEQYFDYPVQALKETKMGCTILAVEKGSEQWLNTRKKPQLLIFSRDGHTITESFLRSVHEEMKKQAVVTSHIITSGAFSPDAIKFAENRPFNLIDRQKLERIVEKVKFTF